MRIAKQYEKHKNVQNVMSYINKESLIEEHLKQQRGNSAKYIFGLFVWF